MAAARLDIPAIFLNGGPMMPAVYKGKLRRQHRHRGGGLEVEREIGEAKFREIGPGEPCVGSCAMLGTANTMGCMAEAMGMSLPGTAVIPAVSRQAMGAAYSTGEAVMELIRGGITARQIIEVRNRLRTP